MLALTPKCCFSGVVPTDHSYGNEAYDDVGEFEMVHGSTVASSTTSGVSQNFFQFIDHDESLDTIREVQSGRGTQSDQHPLSVVSCKALNGT